MFTSQYGTLATFASLAPLALNFYGYPPDLLDAAVQRGSGFLKNKRKWRERRKRRKRV